MFYRQKSSLLISLSIFASACGTNSSLNEKKASDPSSCPSEELAKSPSGTNSSNKTNNTGTAFAFLPDPLAKAGKTMLTANSSRLDEFASPVQLQNLDGSGILRGTHIQVKSGTHCNGGFHAFSDELKFEYKHSEPQFQEAMAYFIGDTFRSKHAEAGINLPNKPIEIISHCLYQDNAFFVRFQDKEGQEINRVCLGDSSTAKGASYSDDATVAIHEIQHASTLYAYDNELNINRHWYDEAGALNEAISDFMSLAFIKRWTNELRDYDQTLFSRWALGQFNPNSRAVRGARSCPEYDSRYPNCGELVPGASGFSAEQNTIHYTYPDGLGWPYANNYTGPGYLQQVFFSYKGREEIHNAGILMTGALYDIYEILETHFTDWDISFKFISKAIIHTIARLPKPTTHLSPVNFRVFAKELIITFEEEDEGEKLPQNIIDNIKNKLVLRGLLDGEQLPSNWLKAGSGVSKTPSVKIIDHSTKLKTWLSQMGQSQALITQGLDPNEKLSPGEVVAIWFDLKNNSKITAGGIQLDITSQNPYVTFLKNPINLGYLHSNRAQIQYQKVNGTDISNALFSKNFSFDVPSINTYFTTNPYFDHTWTTAIWLKTAPELPIGSVVTFEVTAIPSNGEKSVTHFNVNVE